MERSLICLVILLLTCYKCSNGQQHHHLQDAAKFDPYADNGGTVAGLCGDMYTIIAADTRLSDGVTYILLLTLLLLTLLLHRAQGWR